MYDLITFGEAMVRLSPPDFKRIEQTTTLDLNIGGAELNVAVGASRLGLNTAWISRLPDNPLGRMIANKAREMGVDVSPLIWDTNGRAGLYFLELGATPRPTSVVYDRADSSFSRLQPGEIDWKTVLGSTRLLHVTGITPAVSQSCAAATLEALQLAREAGCRISLDLNYRAKLWSPDEANKTLVSMMEYVDILITTEGDTRTILGLEADNDEALARILLDKYPIDIVAVSYREGDTVWRCLFSAIAVNRENTYTTRRYHIDIVDQVGRGDSFAAGFLYGIISEDNPQLGLDYGAALAALKHSFPGDFNWSTKAEVEALLAGPRPGVHR
jgi:2-dehydro-3-deoxygluconokinase